jgi:hypothetical protein
MEVEGRILFEAIRRVEVEPGTGDAAWFAARQPGVVKYLESRLGHGDTMGVALMAAFAIHAAFERSLGVPPPRVPSSALEWAEGCVLAEAQAEAGEPAFVTRQQALASYVAGVVAAPPVPLSDDDAGRLALTLASVVSAFDRATLDA